MGEQNMGKVLDLGIDQLTTDHPDIARRVLSEKNIPELIRQHALKPAKTARQKKLKKHLSAVGLILCRLFKPISNLFDKDFKWF